MKKTIGGDRLGSGKKMQVDLHGYERSTHDLGYIWRSTMSAGTLVPFLKEIALPGDTFDIDLNCDINTHPTIGPLFGSFKVQLDIFQCPIRLYQGQLHNNKLGIGLKMNTVKLPVIVLEAPNTEGLTLEEYKALDLDNFQINSSCIFSYLGIRGIGTNNHTDTAEKERYFNAVPWLGYWDIYKNYYSNKQEEIGAVIHTGRVEGDPNVSSVQVEGDTIPQGASTGGTSLTAYATFDLTNVGTYQDPANIVVLIQTPTWVRWMPLLDVFSYEVIVPPLQQYFYLNNLGTASILAWDYSGNQARPDIDITTFPLEQLDEIREQILLATQSPTAFEIDQSLNILPFDLVFAVAGDGSQKSMTCSQEGLGLKTYQSDLFNNWLSTEWIDGANGISEITAVDTTGGSFTMDTLALSKKVYDMLNRIAISGGTYDDWMDAVYTHDRYTRAETPIYHGGLIKELVFQEVVSQTASSIENNQPLGTLAGKGRLGEKHKGGSVTIKVDEPSYLIGIVSLTPRIDYSQGNDWDVHLMTMDDLHKPALDEIGFQELITEQMAWWDTYYNETTNLWTTKSAGKQPAWINYMTNINRVRGNFAIKDNEMFMTLNRQYAPNIETGAGPMPWDVSIKDLTTYIDPRIYNQIFADTALDSQNFWTQIGVDMKVRRKISAKIMPNL